MKNAQRLRLYLFEAFLIISPAKLCRAQFGYLYYWTNSAGGDYSHSANWLPNGVPSTTNDGAGFDLNSTYTVSLPGAYTVGSLIVDDGNVTYQPTGSFVYTTDTLSVDSPVDGNSSFAVEGDMHVNDGMNIGSSGDAAMSVNDGTLTSSGTELGVGVGSMGHLTIGAFDNWTNTANPVVIGDVGNGHLDLAASFTYSFFNFYPKKSIATTSATDMARTSTASGTATIYGDWQTGDLTVGDAGQATVDVLGTYLVTEQGINVSSVGTLESSMANVGAQSGSSGAVNITGLEYTNSGYAASSWNITSGLALGGTSTTSGGNGTLTVGVMDTVTVGTDLKMWSGGALDVYEDAILTIDGTANLDGTLAFNVPTGLPQPQLNDEFTILTATGGVNGAFDATNLPPLDSGLSWSVLYGPTSVSLQVVEGLQGDYNHDGTVDAADYVVWRKGLGSTYDSTDYNVWRSHFGDSISSGSGMGANAAVPEPRAIALLIAAIMMAAAGRRAMAVI
jgi:hypothetical protein